MYFHRYGRDHLQKISAAFGRSALVEYPKRGSSRNTPGARSARSVRKEAASPQSDLLSRRIRRPNSEPHLTGTRGALINSDVRVARFGSRADAGDAHFVTAMTSGQFGGPWYQQTLNRRTSDQTPGTSCIAAIIAVQRKRKVTKIELKPPPIAAMPC
jgi:hypothetical protein